MSMIRVLFVAVSLGKMSKFFFVATPVQ